MSLSTTSFNNSAVLPHQPLAGEGLPSAADPVVARQRIAVIGAGAAGIAAAHLLQRRHDVVLFEKENRLGGHANTHILEDGPDAGTPVDTGFIVCNDWTYPNFLRFMADLNVPLRDSDMSFSFQCRGSGLQYAGSNLNTLFAQRRNLMRPRFWRMLADIIRFNRAAPVALESGHLAHLTLGAYVVEGGWSQQFVDDYLLPMGAAIWSTPSAQILDFPAEAFVSFCKNHGLLNIENRPTWKTVEGGSHQYLNVFAARFRGEIRLNAAVRHVLREGASVRVVTGSVGEPESDVFDAVVMASHADQTLAMLADASPDEQRVLGPWRYQDNPTVLHSHDGVMPAARRAWSSWNYVRDPRVAGAGVSVSYYMNRLQGLTTKRNYFVTLNGLEAPPQESVVREIMYAHPTYTFDALRSQAELPALQGVRNTYFCGSYHGHGFHEDAVASGFAVAARLGVTL
ncbi:amine oxidase [candidate division BRC1 bacterium HGW-BRC1-1]|nr:MAG: amine oxidase [candidate division BRC1 bacterium HGW-BRC1-1]